MHKVYSQQLPPVNVEMQTFKHKDYDYYMMDSAGAYHPIQLIPTPQITYQNPHRQLMTQSQNQNSQPYAQSHHITSQVQSQYKEFIAGKMPLYNKTENFDYLEEKWFEEYYKLKTLPSYPPTTYVLHPIQLEDTIEGLSLQYGVSDLQIRNFNNLNTNDIYHMREIRIPNPQTNHQGERCFDLEEYKKKLKIQVFMDKILTQEDRNISIAKYYLESANWNFRQAKDEYEEDLQFKQ